jgi:hypothetical protein
MIAPFLLAAINLTAPEHEPTTPAKTASSARIAISTQGRSTILIEAKARSDDLTKAYEALKREKPTLRISAHTVDGKGLANIMDITPMPNGTLLLLRLSTAQGTTYQLISIDEILDLYYNP